MSVPGLASGAGVALLHSVAHLPALLLQALLVLRRQLSEEVPTSQSCQLPAHQHLQIHLHMLPVACQPGALTGECTESPPCFRCQPSESACSCTKLLLGLQHQKHIPACPANCSEQGSLRSPSLTRSCPSSFWGWMPCCCLLAGPHACPLSHAHLRDVGVVLTTSP